MWDPQRQKHRSIQKRRWPGKRRRFRWKRWCRHRNWAFEKLDFTSFGFFCIFVTYSNYEYDIENFLNYSFQPFETWKANLSRLEGTCRKFLKSYFNSADFRNCKKLGAWKKRADGLLDTMNVMKKICLKMRQSGETMYNWSSNNLLVWEINRK